MADTAYKRGLSSGNACELDHLPDFYCTKCHLPECRAKGLGLWDGMGLCICDELRACEQRVTERWEQIARIDRENARADEFKITSRLALDAIKAAYEDGRAAGVQAARDAVAKLVNKITHPWASIGDALAAIDALRAAP